MYSMLMKKYALEKMAHASFGKEKKAYERAIAFFDKKIEQEVQKGSYSWEDVFEISQALEANV